MIAMRPWQRRCPSPVGDRFDVRLSGDGMALRVIAWFINQRSRLSAISTGDHCQFVRRAVFERMGGFPERMNRQLAMAFAAGVKAVLLLGTDSPHMPDSRLMAAVEALKHTDVVLARIMHECCCALACSFARNEYLLRCP